MERPDDKDYLDPGTISFDSLNKGEDAVTREEIISAIGLNEERNITRFSNVKTIGLGGIGSVLSGHEAVLNREIAIKILRPAYRNKIKYLERFVREARATAQIEHPNIVPIHELGVLDDVGPYFTMKKVDGETLKHVLFMLDQQEPEYEKKYSLRYLLEIFISACNGVAFAHSRGVIHRDLKPANIMLGDFGEVMVMDWGLVKHLAENDESRENDDGLRINSALESRDAMVTLDGSISGTPAFMAPEQACGKINEIDEQSDVYSLGAILYSILTRKTSPFENTQNMGHVLTHVVNGHFLSPRKRAPKLNIPKALNSICLKAMSLNKANRYRTVQLLITDIRNYLENYPVEAYPESPLANCLKFCRRHPLIPATLTGALITMGIAYGFQWMQQDMRLTSYLKIADMCIMDGQTFFTRAQNTYEAIMKQDDAGKNGVKSNREIRQEEELSKLEGAFNNQYDLAMEFLTRLEGSGINQPEITKRITKIFKDRIDYYILTGNHAELRRLVNLLKLRRRQAFYDIIQEDNALYKKIKGIMDNKGFLEISTVPYAAFVTLTSLSPEEGAAAQPEVIDLGMTPIDRKELDGGSYLLKISPPGKPAIRYPIVVNIGEKEVVNVFIPGEIPPGTVYIPAGYFYMGGEKMFKQRLHRVFVPGFFIKRYEVTFREYIAFWKSLPLKEKNRFMAMVMIDGGKKRTLIDLWDANGENLREPFEMNYPVVGITREAASAYCNWKSEKTGYFCRLPTAEEWEKAARGVDGRNFVWGEEYQSGYALSLDNEAAKRKYPMFAPPGCFPKDVSVYGVYDLAGNVREFTGSIFDRKSKLYQVKGGSAFTSASFFHCAMSGYPDAIAKDIGFRYVISLENGKPKPFVGK